MRSRNWWEDFEDLGTLDAYIAEGLQACSALSPMTCARACSAHSRGQ